MSDPANIPAATEPTWDMHRDWPLRPFVLAALIGIAALLFYLVGAPDAPIAQQQSWRAGAASAILFAALMLAFTIEEDTPREVFVFAGVTGLVIGGIAWRVANAGEHYSDEPFWMAAGILAGTLALPLFQAGFHRTRWATSYQRTHFHVWTDAISLGGAMAFLGLSWALLLLLAALFSAIEIKLLEDLIDQAWFAWTFSGAAFGAALGVLRNSVPVLGTLQKVVMLVFAILAVPLAAALVLFLLAVALSGVEVLWAATRSATPLLLSVAVGAFVLTNAVLRDSDADMSGSRIQRIAAAALALGILPLAVLAAVSMGVRIAQHGLSPERLWALIAIAVAVAYGVGYFVAAILARRQGWDRLRLANLHLAVGTCVLALLLAMPILDFGAISARDQIARLESGRVSAEKFDYAALRWDFGDAGRAALAQLAKGKGEAAKLAADELAKKQASRWAPPEVQPQKIAFEKDDPALRALVLKHLETNSWLCEDGCYVLDLGPSDKGAKVAIVGRSQVEVVVLGKDGTRVVGYRGADQPDYRPGDKVEIGTVAKRYVLVNGKPVGEPID